MSTTYTTVADEEIVAINEELAQTINLLFRYVIFPCTSFVGIIGSLSSIIILTRQGFRKCSNVLLMAVSVSDILYMVGVNNIPRYIYIQNVPQSYKFSETINRLCFVVYITFSAAYIIGSDSMWINPVLITGERLLAIFLPLKVYLILTPLRTLFIVSIVYILSASHFVFIRIIQFEFVQVIRNNDSLGLMMFTKTYNDYVQSGLEETVGSFINYMTGPVPIGLEIIGCVVIGGQVAIITNRRQQLTSRQDNGTKKKVVTKTTKTLLSICVLYICCSGLSFATSYVAGMSSVSRNTSLKPLIVAVQDYIMCINSVGDFIIYVGANYGFRAVFPKRFKLCP